MAEFSLIPSNSGDLIQSFEEPEGKVFLLYGDALAFRLTLLLAARIMHKSMPVAVVDGYNRFDVHLLSRYARQRRLDPNQFLRRAFVSRGFTCYQMESAVNKLPAFLKKINPLLCRDNSRIISGVKRQNEQGGIAFILGLLDTFYDQQAPFREVRGILERLLIKFYEMKNAGISLLLTSMDLKVVPEERNRFFKQLKINADKVFKVTLNEEGQPKLFLEQENIPACPVSSVPFVSSVLKNLSE